MELRENAEGKIEIQVGRIIMMGNIKKTVDDEGREILDLGNGAQRYFLEKRDDGVYITTQYRTQ